MWRRHHHIFFRRRIWRGMVSLSIYLYMQLYIAVPSWEGLTRYHYVYTYLRAYSWEYPPRFVVLCLFFLSICRSCVFTSFRLQTWREKVSLSIYMYNYIYLCMYICTHIPKNHLIAPLLCCVSAYVEASSSRLLSPSNLAREGSLYAYMQLYIPMHAQICTRIAENILLDSSFFLAYVEAASSRLLSPSNVAREGLSFYIYVQLYIPMHVHLHAYT